MSKYKEIKGFKVQTLATDTIASQVLGGTWASGGNLPTALSSVRGLGPQTAAVAVGGTTAPGPANSATFHYDGSSWSTPPATLNTARGLANISKLGTQTAGIYFGGSPYAANNESYNGSVWTEVNDLNTARQELGGSGTQAAALATGGRISSPAYVANNESWNGSSWTEVNDLNTARGSLDSTGTSTDSIAAGGTIAPASPVVGTNSETWDGTSWTTTTSFSTARRGNSMFGLTSTDALVTGGDTSGNPFPSQSLTGSTEYWNGSSWTELADLATGRSSAGSSGSSTAGLVEGGYGPPSSVLTATEEWTAPSDFTQINLGQVYYNSTANAFKVTKQSVPTGTWSSGGNLNTARERVMNFDTGTQTATLAVGGSVPGTFLANTEIYNGSSWTEVNDLNTARNRGYGTGSSTVAFVGLGGAAPGYLANTETWNGSSWTEVNDANTARGQGGSFGSTTQGIAASGNISPSPPLRNAVNVESWDGTNWTEVAEMNTARNDMGGFGDSYISGVIATGVDNPTNTVVSNVETWNGSAWTEVSEVNTGRQGPGGFGSTSDGIIAGGRNPSGPTLYAQTEIWNGTSWTELNDLATARFALQGGGTTKLGIVFSGFTTTAVANTEEWNAATVNSTITVS